MPTVFLELVVFVNVKLSVMVEKASVSSRLAADTCFLSVCFDS